MGLGLEIPLSKRAKRLEVELPSRRVDGHCHVVVDGTGLKVYGEGEWKVRTHGVGKRRVWRKLHLAVDTESHDILCAVLATYDYHDSEVLPDLLQGISLPIEHLNGYGACDTREVCDDLVARGTNPNIPPRSNAVKRGENHPRNPIVNHCRRKSRAAWKRGNLRSLVETAMYRYKQLISPKLAAREFNRQVTEAGAGVAVINKMISLGIPRRVAKA